MLQSFQLCFIAACCMFTGTLAAGQKTWTYTILGLNSNSSDEKCFKWGLEVVRVGRGDYAISGTIDVGCEITNEHMIEVLVYRSASGGNQYKLQPFKVSKKTINEFLDDTYKNLIMESLKDCSNAPQSVDGKPPRVTTKVIKLDKCTLSTDLLPSHMQPGYYKIILLGTGKITFYLEFLAEIEQKM